MNIETIEKIPPMTKPNENVLAAIAAVGESKTGIIEITGAEKPRSLCAAINKHAASADLNIKASCRKDEIVYVRDTTED